MIVPEQMDPFHQFNRVYLRITSVFMHLSVSPTPRWWFKVADTSSTPVDRMGRCFHQCILTSCFHLFVPCHEKCALTSLRSHLFVFFPSPCSQPPRWKRDQPRCRSLIVCLTAGADVCFCIYLWHPRTFTCSASREIGEPGPVRKRRGADWPNVWTVCDMCFTSKVASGELWDLTDLDSLGRGTYMLETHADECHQCLHEEALGLLNPEMWCSLFMCCMLRYVSVCSSDNRWRSACQLPPDIQLLSY